MRRLRACAAERISPGLRRRGRRYRRANISRSTVATLLPSDLMSLLGISVSKSVGPAVVRNKLRRRLAAIVHEALADHRPGRLLVIPRPSAAQAEFQELRAELLAGLGRL